MNLLIAAIVLGFGFTVGAALVPIVLRLAVFLGMLILGALAVMFIFSDPVLLMIVGIIAAIVAIAWCGDSVARQIKAQTDYADDREHNIAAMRTHFAEEMEIRLRNEGYYLPPKKEDR